MDAEGEVASFRRGLFYGIAKDRFQAVTWESLSYE